jgi:hypothetical protein
MRSVKIDLTVVADCACLLLIFVFLCFFFSPDLILSNTTTTGGDTGSHFAPAHYLKNYLLPHGKLIGWYPGWLAGTPMFQFYFVPPYLLMALLSYAIPLEVAFKLVSVLGVFLLPVATYFSMRALRFEFPAPAIAAGFSTALLFLETYSQWGGNIMSTLAGEFSYMLSFSLAILFFGVLYFGVEKNRHVVPCAVLLASVVLTHIYTGIFVTAVAVFFLLVSGRSKNLIYLIKVFFLAGMITGFWTIPLLSKIAFSAAPKDIFYGFPELEKFISSKFAIFYVFAAVSVGAGLVSRDRRTRYFLWAVLCLTFLMLFIHYANLLYIRFVPFIYFLPLMLAADGLARLSRGMKARSLFPIIAVLATLIWVALGPAGVITEAGLGGEPMIAPVVPMLENSPLLSSGIKNTPSWIRWNYEGLEKKDTYDEFIAVNEYLKAGNLSGRVDFEYAEEYNKFGTPRVFEVSPVFSNRSVLESLFLESSLTFPFFYYIQKQVSQEAWWPGFPLEVPSFTPDAGAESLRLYNVQYFVAISEKTKTALSNNSRYRLLSAVGEFNVYAVNEDSQYVEVAEKEPVLVLTDDWKHYAYDWMSSSRRDVPLVFSKSIGEYELKHFRIIVVDKSVSFDRQGKAVYYPEDLSAAIEEAGTLDRNCSTTEKVSEEEVKIHTDCVGKPLIVKISYFPNWMAEGAEKVYIVSPSIMLIIPEQQDVRFYYGETDADRIGNLFSVLGIALVLYWLLLYVRPFRENVHQRLVKVVWAGKLERFLEDMRSNLMNTAGNIALKVRKNLLVLLAVLVILLIISVAAFYFGEKKVCDSFCVSRSFSGGEKYFRSEVVDYYHLGYAHQFENIRRGFECTAACDSSRPEMVYVSNGLVAFNISLLPGVDNTLVLNMWDNVNCKSGDLYINDRFATRIEGKGKFNWHDYEIKIAKEYATTSSIRVRLEHVNTDCYGWDLSAAYVKVPSCICY